MLKNTYLASTTISKSRIFYCDLRYERTKFYSPDPKEQYADSCIGRVRKASTMKTILLHSTPDRAKLRLISKPLIRNLSTRR